MPRPIDREALRRELLSAASLIADPQAHNAPYPDGPNGRYVEAFQLGWLESWLKLLGDRFDMPEVRERLVRAGSVASW